MPSSFRSPRNISKVNEIKSSKWEAVGNSRSALKEQLGNLYWDGVRQELKVILFTLKKLQQPACKEVLEREQETLSDDTPFGFETFVDQVSLESRRLAYSYGIHHFPQGYYTFVLTHNQGNKLKVMNLRKSYCRPTKMQFTTRCRAKVRNKNPAI